MMVPTRTRLLKLTAVTTLALGSTSTVVAQSHFANFANSIAAVASRVFGSSQPAVQSPPTTANEAANALSMRGAMDGCQLNGLTMTCNRDTIRFLALADWGARANPGVAAVANAMIQEVNNVDFVIAAGDNFYDFGVTSVHDKHWTDYWVTRFGIGTRMNVPWFVALGNHDHFGNANAQIQYNFAGMPGSQFWIMPQAIYSININGPGGKGTFFFLDTEKFSQEQLVWLQTSAAGPGAKFVVGHHPVFSSSNRGDGKGIMSALGQLLTMLRVNAYIAGHEHDMQFLTSGGVDHFGVGGGGKSLNKPTDRKPSQANVEFYQASYGFGIFEVNLATGVAQVTYKTFDTNGAPAGDITFARQYVV